MPSNSALQLSMLSDAEVQSSIAEFFQHDAIRLGMASLLPPELCQQMLQVQREIKNATDFQRKLMVPFLKFVEEISIDGLSNSGLDQLAPEQKYLFVSNHRDIGLDSAFLNIALFQAGFTTTQIAIGDNLMTHRLAELIFRINKSFAVMRTGSPRELYTRSQQMSAYIHETITQGQDSVWLAQREGRAKDGNDLTQIGILKMLSLSKQSELLEHVRQLNIVPVAISYEYDPTDWVKTTDHLRKLAEPNYKKAFSDDIQHILLGIKGQKGRVHLHFGPPLNATIDKLAELPNEKKQLVGLVKMIDSAIHQGYQLRPVNYVAYDLLHESDAMQHHYTATERTEVEAFFAKKFSRLKTEEITAGQAYLLGIYANPVANSLST